MKTFAIRLTPHQDVKEELKLLTQKEQIRAGVILTIVGSLQQANLRMANKNEGTIITDDLEIVSCTGTLGPDGMHLHMSVADPKGNTIGGHVMEGCIVRTTAEIVIGDLLNFTFTREIDDETGFRELVPLPRK